MAETVFLDHQPISIPNGTQTHGPFDIPDGATEVEFRIARSTTATPTLWPSSGTTLSAQIECSFDGGTNWELQSGFGATGGGVQPFKGGEMVDNFLVLLGLRLAPNRKIRGKTTVVNGPVITQLTVKTR